MIIHDGDSGLTASIDAPDGDAILERLEARHWTLTHIFTTHKHGDHVEGNLALKERYGCEIIGPAGEAAKIPGLDRAVRGGDTVQLGALTAHVLDVPGHTLGHIAFHLPEASTAFVGDAVFALGCGRVFEGDMAMMWASMQVIKALPPQTTLYCAHEYTQANARFAETIETANPALRSYIAEIDAKRARGERTVPMDLARELETNPFLRADQPALQAAMGHPGDAVATFGEIRGRKDRF